MSLLVIPSNLTNGNWGVETTQKGTSLILMELDASYWSINNGFLHSSYGMSLS